MADGVLPTVVPPPPVFPWSWLHSESVSAASLGLLGFPPSDPVHDVLCCLKHPEFTFSPATKNSGKNFEFYSKDSRKPQEGFKQENSTDEIRMLGKNPCVILELHCHPSKRLVGLGLLGPLLWVTDKISFLYESLLGNIESSQGQSIMGVDYSGVYVEPQVWLHVASFLLFFLPFSLF